MTRKKLMPVLLLAVVALTGCGQKKEVEKAHVSVENYEKLEHDVVQVEKGDLTPQIKVEVKAETFLRRSYMPVYDDMEVDKVNVAVGDHVKEGDELITFKSSELDEEIAAYQEQLGEQQLLLEHYTKLSEIDSETDYETDIENLQDSIAVCSLYIQELQAKQKSYSVIAEADGTVQSVANGLEYSTVSTNNNLITVVYGNDCFSATTSEDFNFIEGERYVGVYGAASFDLILQSVEEVGTEADGRIKKKLSFVAAEGVDVGSRETMVITFNKPQIKNALYIPTSCIYEFNEKFYIYIVDADGFLSIKEVECGDEVGTYTIILSGVSEGEWVVTQ
ncbi:MAG: hypothetical protein PUB54_07275 [Lachnospiraceae bacterium]|nr:hypothetical protein [Lachnospiraceae bacterium]